MVTQNTVEEIKAERSDMDLALFGIPNSAGNDSEPEEELQDKEPVEEDIEDEPELDEETEEVDDGEDQEDDSDTDPTEDYDVDTKAALEKEQQKTRDYQSKIDTLNMRLSQSEARHSELTEKMDTFLERLDNQQQNTSQRSGFLDGYDEDDVVYVKDVKKAYADVERNKRESQPKPKKKEQQQPIGLTQKDVSWMSAQSDQVDVRTFINQNVMDLNMDPRFNDLNVKETFLMARTVMKEKELERRQPKKKNQNKRPRTPRVGGNHPKARSASKKKLTPLEDLMGR